MNTETKHKTFDDFKDEIARMHNCQTWSEMQKDLFFIKWEDVLLSRLEEAHNLHLEHQKRRVWDKACEAQKKICFKQYEQVEIRKTNITKQIQEESRAILDAPLADYDNEI